MPRSVPFHAMQLAILAAIACHCRGCPEASAADDQPERVVEFLESAEFARKTDHTDPYPFCLATAGPSLFAVSVDETTRTLSLRGPAPRLDLRIDYSGSCVLWQYYSEIADQYQVSVEAPRDAYTPGHFMQRSEQLEGMRKAGTHHPFENGIVPRRNPDLHGIVFCGDAQTTESVRRTYLQDKAYFLSDARTTEDIKAGWENIIITEREYQLEVVRLVSDGFERGFFLNDFLTFSKPGTYSIRLGYCLYPKTNWGSLCAPLNDQLVVWSNPIPLEVIE